MKHEEQFLKRTEFHYGEMLTLTCPRKDAIFDVWDSDNLQYRSVITDKTGFRVSCGYHKFFNHGEHPELYPDPNQYNDWSINEKLDGSLLMISYHNGQIIARTRGSFNAIEKFPDSAGPLEYFLNQHREVFTKSTCWDKTFLFEWIDPKNRIVINYGGPTRFVLLDIIDNIDYRYYPVEGVDAFAKLHDFERPRRYLFDNIQQLLLDAKDRTDFEGYVLSYNNNQNRIKLKSDWYMQLHYLKAKHGGLRKWIVRLCEAEVRTVNDLERYLKNGKYDYEELKIVSDKIEKLFDMYFKLEAEYLMVTDIAENMKKRFNGDKKAIANELRTDPNRGEIFSILNHGQYTMRQIQNKLLEMKEEDTNDE